MRAARMVMMRTFGVLAGSLSTTVAVMVFLGVSGGLFAKALLGGEGGLTPVAVLWALSAAPALPVLTAVLTMRLVADERTSGRLELILSAPVRERSVVVGKFLGAWLHAALALALYLSVPLVLLPRCAPALSAHLAWDVFLPAYGALLMQAALWCAFGLLASVCFRPAAVAAVVSLVVTVVLPFAAYQAAFTWLQAFRVRFSEHPFTGHLVDLSTGLVQLSTLLFYFAFTACALFAAADGGLARAQALEGRVHVQVRRMQDAQPFHVSLTPSADRQRPVPGSISKRQPSILAGPFADS